MSSTPPTQDPISTPMGLGSGPSQEERTHATLSWVLSIFFGFIPGLIFFLMATDKPFLKRHAAMALGLNIAVMILYAVLFITIIGPLVVWVAAIVFSIMGAVAANKGEAYDVPLIGPMLANMFKV
jgi:uncharacterized membrane protein